MKHTSATIEALCSVLPVSVCTLEDGNETSLKA